MSEGAGVESLWGVLVYVIVMEYNNDDLPLGAQLHFWKDDV